MQSLRPFVIAAVLVAAVSGVAGCRAIERAIQKLDELDKQMGTPRGQMLAKRDEIQALRRQLTDALVGGPPISESEGRRIRNRIVFLEGDIQGEIAEQRRRARELDEHCRNLTDDLGRARGYALAMQRARFEPRATQRGFAVGGEELGAIAAAVDAEALPILGRKREALAGIVSVIDDEAYPALESAFDWIGPYVDVELDEAGEARWRAALIENAPRDLEALADLGDALFKLAVIDPGAGTDRLIALGERLSRALATGVVVAPGLELDLEVELGGADVRTGDAILVELPRGFGLGAPLEVGGENGVRVDATGNRPGSRAIALEIASAPEEAQLAIRTAQQLRVRSAARVGEVVITHSRLEESTRVRVICPRCRSDRWWWW